MAVKAHYGVHSSPVVSLYGGSDDKDTVQSYRPHVHGERIDCGDGDVA